MQLREHEAFTSRSVGGKTSGRKRQQLMRSLNRDEP